MAECLPSAARTGPLVKPWIASCSFSDAVRKRARFSSARQPFMPGRRATLSVRASRVRFATELTTDIPLRERYGVPFEKYMSEKDRIFRTFFPDKERSEQLNSEEWRIYMLPMDFFFLTVRPVVDMRLWLTKSANSGSSQTLSLQATRCELRGVDVKPSDFILGVNGSMNSVKVSSGMRLRGRMSLRVDLAVPDTLMFVPSPTIEAVGNVLLNQLLEAMQDKVNSQVLADYSKYAWEERALLQLPPKA